MLPVARDQAPDVVAVARRVRQDGARLGVAGDQPDVQATEPQQPAHRLARSSPAQLRHRVEPVAPERQQERVRDKRDARQVHAVGHRPGQHPSTEPLGHRCPEAAIRRLRRAWDRWGPSTSTAMSTASHITSGMESGTPLSHPESCLGPGEGGLCGGLGAVPRAAGRLCARTERQTTVARPRPARARAAAPATDRWRWSAGRRPGRPRSAGSRCRRASSAAPSTSMCRCVSSNRVRTRRPTPEVRRMAPRDPGRDGQHQPRPEQQRQGGRHQPSAGDRSPPPATTPP